MPVSDCPPAPAGAGRLFRKNARSRDRYRPRDGQPATDAATNPASDPESATDTETETETKPVTEPLRLTSNRELTFAPLPDCKGFLYVENAECEAVPDEA